MLLLELSFFISLVEFYPAARRFMYNPVNFFDVFLFAAFHDLLLPPLRATVRAAAGPTAAGDHPEAATPTPAPAPATPTTAAAASPPPPAPAGRGGRTGRTVVGGCRRRNGPEAWATTTFQLHQQLGPVSSAVVAPT